MRKHSNDLERFVNAQEVSYQTALREIKEGCKRSHWMWYIFPQIAGLGLSPTAQYYAICDLQEAVRYLKHPILGPRLIEMSRELLKLNTNNPTQILGCPDDLKLRSCMTLFSIAKPEETVFTDVLHKFYNGEKDELTLRILNKEK
jgi:uncharacterized protein (DUF1810 family)